ncbi:MAG: DUF1566 domain-containing protein [Saprospiraceae bacterium]|nr:DUF1566 domain-containing protein [Saprospiraceae bacterium]
MTRFALFSTALLCLVLLAACSDSEQVGPEIHDTKYRSVTATGEMLGPEIAEGPCVQDVFTSLVWEVKSEQAGLHHRDNTYSWFDPDEAVGELDYRGLPDGGSCQGSACDTHAFVTVVNETALCGYTDWRMPSRDELGSLSDPRKGEDPPTINTRYFPNTRPGEYWSGNDYQFQWDTAWLWNFENGLDRVEWKKSPRYVRLVRGTPRGVVRVED